MWAEDGEFVLIVLQWGVSVREDHRFVRGGDEEDMWAEDGEFVLIVLQWCVSVREDQRFVRGETRKISGLKTESLC